jgi:methionyl aminopeptidase
MEQVILGRTVAKAFKDVQRLIDPYDHVNDIVNIIEDRIWGAGFELAFPISVAINNCVAHNEAFSREVLGFRMVKIDAGAMFEGLMVDSAITIDFDGTTKLAQVCEDALMAVLNVAKAGMPVRDIGLIIESEVAKSDYLVVANLGGHGIAKNQIHAPPYIANITNDSVEVLREDHVYAIEPLISNGRGKCFIKEGSDALWEVEGSLVAHFEHSIYIHKGSNTVLTARY